MVRPTLAVALFLVGGCSVLLNEKESEDAGVGSTCAAEGDCGDLICSPDRQCVPCSELELPDVACLEADREPLCSRDRCLECRRNADCASEACDVIAGTCLDESDVLYVRAGANGDCRKVPGTTATPCGSVADALQARNGQPVIVIDSAAVLREDIRLNETIRIIGFGATLSQMDEGDSPLLVGSGGVVTVEGLTITGTTGIPTAGQFPAITCANTGSVTLREVRIVENDGRALLSASCTVQIERSTIQLNARGGLDLQGTSFAITHSVITDNGGTESVSTIGAVRLDSATPKAQVFDFNTVANNFGEALTCETANDVPVRGSIIAKRVDPGAVLNVGSTCVVERSVYPADADNTTENVLDEPQFFGEDTGDYRLVLESPGQDVLGLGALISVGDLDAALQLRSTTAPDMGAFELRN